VLVGAFTVPKVYEVYKVPIDEQWAKIDGHVQPVLQQCVLHP